MKESIAILVVDDEPQLRDGIQSTLEAEGYRVLAAGDGVDALAVLQSQSVDLILADIAMPRMNGYQLYERVRENPRWMAIPFVFLTARAMDSDVRYGRELGVDDYLTKPIDAADMLAAIKGKLRRAEQLAQQSIQVAPSSVQPRSLAVGRLQINPAQHRVLLGEEPVDLSAREFALLKCLAERVSHVVSPQELIQATHGLDTDPVEAGALLRPLIRSLRRKLGYPIGDMGCIETVRGVGYRLIPPKS